MAHEASMLHEEPLSLESESDDSSSDLSSVDTDEERMHFVYRLDPAEDFSDDSEENTPLEPARKRARRHTKRRRLSKSSQLPSRDETMQQEMFDYYSRLMEQLQEKEYWTEFRRQQLGQTDECTDFGRAVADMLRNVPEHLRMGVKDYIINLLEEYTEQD